MKFGIDAASYYVPKLYLEISELANARGIDPLKLEKGLGLQKMALLDLNQDTATMAAEALLRLIRDYGLVPQEIAKVYLGTESALDAAKPTATLAVQMVEQVLEKEFGSRVFKNCDVVDMTFACIGGVDALQNAIDYVKANPHKKAVVIASDYAKYELASSGEYTQGGGAVALLISAEPRLLVIENAWGVATESVFDFFKPRRNYLKSDLKNAPDSFPDKIEIFSDEPVFDGHYSNECYKNRISEAYQHFKEEKGSSAVEFDAWRYLVFHLPYAFHGKRIFSEIYGTEKQLPAGSSEELKAIAQSEAYKKLIAEKIEPTQRASSAIGNMYTASVFMALLSGLQVSFDQNENLEGENIGFLAYGSGSKSKIFEGTVAPSWKQIVEKWNLFQELQNRIPVDFPTYEKLHRKQLPVPVSQVQKGFFLQKTEEENPVLKGARYYEYKE